MNAAEVLNEELKRLHETYSRALEIERLGIRLRGEGFHEAIFKQIQAVHTALLAMAFNEGEKHGASNNEGV
jgi:hypothetical protein